MLEVIIGSMYAGKSTSLYNRALDAEEVGKRLIIFKPSIDNRYSEDEMVTHDGSSWPCTVIKEPKEMMDIVNDYDVVLIDEAQFFPPNLAPYVEMIASTKSVAAAGLLTDFRGQPFPSMVPLICMADSIIHVHAKCSDCDSPYAAWSQRIVDGKPVTDGEVVLVGGAESYEPKCRDCFVTKNTVVASF